MKTTPAMNSIQFDQEAFAKLSDREIQAVALASNGLTAKEIAMEMNIATRTAQAHLTSAIQKLNCQNTTHVAATLIRGRIIQ
jgi:DNA-binding NarL/FixJ family response regulator